MPAGTWTVAEAKAKFSEVLEQSRVSGPQTITKHGRVAAVIVSAQEWEQKTQRRGTLAAFLAESPLRESGLTVHRVQDDPPRDRLVNYLLDTNVVSEWTKPRPDPGVMAWLGDVDEDRAFLSVITLAELRHGVERMPIGNRRDRLDAWLVEQVPRRFGVRILPIDAAIAGTWGRVMARARIRGRSLGSMDACIAATAEQHDLTLVTRNVADFDLLGIHLLNPWHAG